MKLPQLLGIDLPIIQAPMAGVQGSALAVAVSNAGGLGSLPCAMLGLDAMREELTKIRTRAEPARVCRACDVALDRRHSMAECRIDPEENGVTRYPIFDLTQNGRRIGSRVTFSSSC